MISDMYNINFTAEAFEMTYSDVLGVATVHAWQLML